MNDQEREKSKIDEVARSISLENNSSGVYHIPSNWIPIRAFAKYQHILQSYCNRAF